MHDQMPGNSTALNPQWKTQSFVRWVTNTFRFLLPSMISSCELWGQLSGTLDGVDLESAALFLTPRQQGDIRDLSLVTKIFRRLLLLDSPVKAAVSPQLSVNLLSRGRASVHTINNALSIVQLPVTVCSWLRQINTCTITLYPLNDESAYCPHPYGLHPSSFSVGRTITASSSTPCRKLTISRSTAPTMSTSFIMCSLKNETLSVLKHSSPVQTMLHIEFFLFYARTPDYNVSCHISHDLIICVPQNHVLQVLPLNLQAKGEDSLIAKTTYIECSNDNLKQKPTRRDVLTK